MHNSCPSLFTYTCQVNHKLMWITPFIALQARKQQTKIQMKLTSVSVQSPNPIKSANQDKTTAKKSTRLDCVQLHCLLFAEIRDTIRITIRKEIGKNYICYNMYPSEIVRLQNHGTTQNEPDSIRLNSFACHDFGRWMCEFPFDAVAGQFSHVRCTNRRACARCLRARVWGIQLLIFPQFICNWVRMLEKL